MLQSVGVNCNAPDLEFIFVSAFLRLYIIFRSLFLCELDQRPLILQSIGVNCNAQDVGFILLSSLFRLISLTRLI